MLDPSEGKKTLGVILAPDGNNKAAVKELREKAVHWRNLIKTGHIDNRDAWLALQTTIYKTLQYPLPALTLTEKECNHVMAPMLMGGLSSSGINRNIPREILYGPKNEGGLGLWNLYDFQGLSQIAFLVEHISNNNMSGDLLRCSIESAHIELGTGKNIFLLNFDKYGPLLTECWIKNIWRYAYENGIVIQEKVTKKPTKQRMFFS